LCLELFGTLRIKVISVPFTLNQTIENDNMSIWKLRLSMVGTLALIFGLSTLVFAVLLSFAGIFDFFTLGIIVVVINIAQWLLSPYIVDAFYKVKPLADNENPQLHQTVKNLSMKSGISVPKLMISKIPLPNAFAYGSPLTGNRVAVTEGLLKSLNDGEVEAVIGHELGHLKHRDVQTMMVVSFLPALFYYIGFSLLWSGGSRDRNNGGYNALIAIAFMAFSWVLNLFILYLSRIREYYADRHSVSVVDNGAQKLSTGLARIVQTTHNITRGQKQTRQEKRNLSAFKALFIADPDKAAADSAALNAEMSGQSLVNEILAKKPTLSDKIIEALSTHPNIVKRLRALQELS
jgi:heat shock protein HtpX